MLSGAKYEEIKQDLIQKILLKELLPGEKIFSESELKSKYSVSSTTVVKALNELSSEGYIYRVQGKGSYVSKALRGGSVKFFENDYKYYDRSLEHTEVIKVDDEVTSEIKKNFRSGIKIKKITRIKLSENNPIQLIVTYIDNKYIKNSKKEQLKSVYAAVKKETSINLFNAKFEENFRVVYPAPDDVCRELGLKEGSPAIRIEQRTYSNDDELIELIHSFKRWDYFNITVTSV